MSGRPAEHADGIDDSQMTTRSGFHEAAPVLRNDARRRGQMILALHPEGCADEQHSRPDFWQATDGSRRRALSGHNRPINMSLQASTKPTFSSGWWSYDAGRD